MRAWRLWVFRPFGTLRRLWGSQAPRKPPYTFVTAKDLERKFKEALIASIVASRNNGRGFLQGSYDMEKRGEIRLLSSKPGAPCDFAECRACVTCQDERIVLACGTCGMERLWLAPGLVPESDTGRD
jgi:hypothetical protein